MLAKKEEREKTQVPKLEKYAPWTEYFRTFSFHYVKGLKTQ